MSNKVSYNIKYDFDNDDIIDSYYASGSHSEILKSVLKGVIGKSNVNSHIAYGPYGSGKSYIASILTGILSGCYKEKQIKKLIEKYSLVDDDTVEVLYDYIHNKKLDPVNKYIPIILNGYEGNFNTAIANAISKALYKNKVKIILPGSTSKIVEIIKKWKNKFKNTYDLFVNLIKENNYEIKEYIELIKIGDKNAIDNFVKLYPSLTSGSEFHVDADYPTSELITNVCEQLRRKKIGLILVYDEFGRYLQSLKQNDLNLFMQEMQSIAEYANRKDGNFIALFIAHKPISYYFNTLDKDQRMEFAKVEKRYITYEIKNDNSSFINITAEALKSLEITKNQKYIDDLINDNKKYYVFDMLNNDNEIDNIIISKLYPLHPITTFLLPKISSIFGQNERTLFSFIFDESSLGLTGFIKKNPTMIYYPDYLFDYFLLNIDESYVEHIKDYKTLINNLYAIPNLKQVDYSSEVQRIYRFMMLWRFINGDAFIKLSEKFISYCLGMNESLVKLALENLNNLKLVRYNIITSKWEIFDGSSLDINNEVQIRLSSKTISDDLVIEYLDKINHNKYIYSERYNMEFEMTRFAYVSFIIPEFSKSKSSQVRCDFRIIISNSEYLMYEEDVLYVISSFDFNQIKTMIKRLIIIEDMLSDNILLSDHKNLESELLYEKDKIFNELSVFYDSIFTKKSKYIFNSELISIVCLNDISIFLSDFFYEQYPRTLIITNDQINMFQLTKIQYNALARILDEIIQNCSIELEHNGNQPIDLTYYSLFRYLREDRNSIEKYDELSNLVNQYLSNNPNGYLIDLVSIAMKRPYGLRPLVAIVLTFGMIVDKLKDIMFFSNGNYISSINGEEIMYLLENDKMSLKYSYNEFDFENRIYLEELYNIFQFDSDLTKNKSLSIRVCSGLYNWYLELPVITQQQEDMGLAEIHFLNLIARSRVNPINALLDIMSSFTIEDIILIKGTIDNHIDLYLANFEARIKKEMNISEFYIWAIKQESIIKKTNKFVKLIIEKQLTNNKESIVAIYGRDVENISINRWTKSSFESIRNRIKNDILLTFKKFQFNTVLVNGVERQVQKVDLSEKAQIMHQNLKNTVDATKKYLTEAEVEQVILSMLEEYVKV